MGIFLLVLLAESFIFKESVDGGLASLSSDNSLMLAVRGCRTRDLLLAQQGLNPLIIGDPALLAPGDIFSNIVATTPQDGGRLLCHSWRLSFMAWRGHGQHEGTVPFWHREARQQLQPQRDTHLFRLGTVPSRGKEQPSRYNILACAWYSGTARCAW
jgi:hypothetical protein